jgi:hypothetical protein
MNITIIKPFENSLTKRGTRMPTLADLLTKSGYRVTYISSDFYHAEKRFFSKKEISAVKNIKKYEQVFYSVPGYNTCSYFLIFLTADISFLLKNLFSA